MVRLILRSLLASLGIAVVIGSWPGTPFAASLSGLVLDQEHKVPVPHAVVFIGESARAEADVVGRFRLDGLQAGEVILRVEHVGYETWSRMIVLKDMQTFELTVRLRAHVETLETVEVGASRPDPSVPQGKETITPMRIRRAAGAVATDPLRVVQALPGVSAAAGDDFSDQYVVRGGDPEENTVLYDGYPILRPVHLEGFTSVIYDDLVGGVEFYPGALPPRYGDALSSVTVLGAPRPEKGQRFFRYDLGSIALGGQGARGPFSVIGAARSSFYNLIIRRPPGVDSRSFRDLTGKATWRNGGTETSLTAVGTRDRESGDITRAIDGYVVGLRTGSFAGSRQWHAVASVTESNGKATYFQSNYQPPLVSRADLRRESLGFDLLAHSGSNIQARIDAEGRNEQFADLTQRQSSRGGFTSLEGTWSGERGAASIGSRLEKIPFTRGMRASPYVSVRYRGFGRFVPGLAYRIVHQSPFDLTESPEVAGLPVPETLFQTGRDRLPPLQAEHVSGAFDVTIGRGVVGGVEIYRKSYSRLLTWPAAGTGPITADGTGLGHGATFSLRREGRGTSGSLSYTVSRTRKREGPAIAMRPADYDQPQMLQASLDIPLHGGTSLSVGYRAASGRPYTPLDVKNDTIVPGLVNSERLPSYHRLDAKIEHRTFAAKTSAFLYLDVLNIMNQKNTVDVVQFKAMGGRIMRIFPQGVRILPVAGFGFYF